MSSATLPAAVTSFGDVPIRVLRDPSTGELPDWSQAVAWAVHPVAGSSKTYRQKVHVGPRSVEYRVLLDTDDDATALLALVAAGEPQTLTLVDGTATVGGDYEFVHGKGYRRIADVLLVSLEPILRRHTGESEWLATFELVT